MVRRCERSLWNDPDHLNYLRSRGLSNATIKAARLGLGVDPPGIFQITIPWFHHGKLRAVNCRRFDWPPKYKCERGSRKGTLYPDVSLDPARPVLLCEGEFDTLLANQEAGQLVQAVTCGSASDASLDTVAALSLCPLLIFAFDSDTAGNKATARLLSFLPHGIRLPLPTGKDLTDVHLEQCYLRRAFPKFLKRVTR